jgi:hypothetical protein
MAQFLSILPPENEPPIAIVWIPPPKPTTQGLVAGGATASAVATGIFAASTVVLLSYVDVFPVELFVAVDVPPCAEFVEFNTGETLLVLEFEFALLLCEFAFELLLLVEPLDEEFWFDVFCVEFTDAFCDCVWD